MRQGAIHPDQRVRILRPTCCGRPRALVVPAEAEDLPETRHNAGANGSIGAGGLQGHGYRVRHVSVEPVAVLGMLERQNRDTPVTSDGERCHAVRYEPSRS